MFYLWHTAHSCFLGSCRTVRLWFAFNVLSLTYRTQQLMGFPPRLVRCDLLSMFYLWHTAHSCHYAHHGSYSVVICFQCFIFDIPHTAVDTQTPVSSPLWFAFNVLSLTYRTQQFRDTSQPFFSCDLLSMFYLWHTAHSVHSHLKYLQTVVICFQCFIFDIPHTAFSVGLYHSICCDLLSMFYLWHTAHSSL